MSNVTLEIAGRRYTVACAAGEEAHIEMLGASISGKLAAPTYQTAYAGVDKAVVVDPRTVRFDLKERSLDALFNAGH